MYRCVTPINFNPLTNTFVKVNGEYKEVLKGQFHDWYAEKVGVDRIPLRWLIFAQTWLSLFTCAGSFNTRETMEENKALITKGYSKSLDLRKPTKMSMK